MRFKSQQKASKMPDINLIPMMDVVMTILTFFVLVSMTLTNQKALNISLPSVNGGGGSELKTATPLIVGLAMGGEISVQNQIVSKTELDSQIKAYLANNPQGELVLRVDKAVPYEQLAQLLSQMQAMGGERVSLAIEG